MRLNIPTHKREFQRPFPGSYLGKITSGKGVQKENLNTQIGL